MSGATSLGLRGPAARQRVSAGPALAEALLLAVLVTAAAAAFGASYGGSAWLVAAAGGAVLGTVVSWSVAVLRWHPAVAVLAGAAVYLLFGGALATPTVASGKVLPTLESVRLLALGVVTSWKQSLTVAVPIGSSGALLVPVYFTALVCGAVGAGVLLRTGRPLLALLAPMVMLVVAGLMGADRSFAPVVAGGVVAVGGLLLASLIRRRQGRGGIDLRRWISAVVVLAAAVTAALYLGPAVTVPTGRVALRNQVAPPFDPQDYPSPLSGFRQYFASDAAKAATLFTVTGLPAGASIRLATLDTYDGVSYSVSTDAGSFDRVGDQVATDVAGSAVDLDVRIGTYRGVYLPDAGALTGIGFAGPDRSSLTESFRYAGDSGVGVEPAGVTEGDDYRLTAVLPGDPPPTQLQSATVTQTGLEAPSRIPDLAKTFATKYAGTADTDYARVVAIQQAIKSQGYLSHGSQAEEPSPSGEGLDRMTRLLGAARMVGDQEQYAPAMSLMLWSLNIPNRVVMGFSPKAQGPGPIAVTGADVTAWVEVDFDGHGWVSFDPTPDENRVTQQPTPQPQAAPRQQVLQPPPPPQLPQQAKASDADQTDSRQNDDQQKDKDKAKNPGGSGGGAHWVLGLAVGLPVLLVGLPILTILLLKSRRRKRRRTSGPPPDRIAGGWNQIIDEATDLGCPVTARSTRSEAAEQLDAHFASGTALLAREADARVFGPDGPAAEEAARFWSEVDAALLGLQAGQSVWRRLRARLSLASLRRGKV